MSAAVLPLRPDCQDFRARRLSADSPGKKRMSLIERLTICISEVEGGFVWEILDWQGQPLSRSTGNLGKDEYPSFNAAWVAAVDQASLMAARAMSDYQRHRLER